MGRRIGSCCAMDEAQDRGMELIAPFVAPSEASSTVAFSMVRVDLAIGPVIADQPLPRVHARQEQEGNDGDQGHQGRLRT